MSDPVRAPSTPPAAGKDAERRHRFPEDAFPPDVRRRLAKGERDPVDVEDALAWLNGEGPDPWTEGSH